MQTIDPPRRNLAIAAAALAGFVDAIGFLSAGGYFVSFMSGNTTRLGVDLIASPRSAIVPSLMIAGFFSGVLGGALLAARAGDRRKAWVLGSVAILLALAASASLFDGASLRIAFLVLAMGALNNTFQRDGTVTVGLTYMTGAIVRAAQGLAARLSGAGGEGWTSWLLLWLGLSLGAIAGAAAQTIAPELALWIAAGWAGVLTLAAMQITRR